MLDNIEIDDMQAKAVHSIMKIVDVVGSIGIAYKNQKTMLDAALADVQRMQNRNGELIEENIKLKAQLRSYRTLADGSDDINPEIKTGV